MGQDKGNGLDREFHKEFDATDELEAQLAEEKKKSEEYLDNWRRAAAEFQNYKRRTDKDKVE